MAKLSKTTQRDLENLKAACVELLVELLERFTDPVGLVVLLGYVLTVLIFATMMIAPWLVEPGDLPW